MIKSSSEARFRPTQALQIEINNPGTDIFYHGTYLGPYENALNAF
jgi:hypothetical protein